MCSSMRTRGHQDFAFCWTVGASGARSSAIPVEEGTGMDRTSTAAPQGAIARNLVEFRGHEQATRVDSEIARPGRV